MIFLYYGLINEVAENLWRIMLSSKLRCDGRCKGLDVNNWSACITSTRGGFKRIS